MTSSTIYRSRAGLGGCGNAAARQAATRTWFARCRSRYPRLRTSRQDRLTSREVCAAPHAGSAGCPLPFAIIEDGSRSSKLLQLREGFVLDRMT